MKKKIFSASHNNHIHPWNWNTDALLQVDRTISGELTFKKTIFGIFASLTFDLSVGNMTLNKPP